MFWFFLIFFFLFFTRIFGRVFNKLKRCLFNSDSNDIKKFTNFFFLTIEKNWLIFFYFDFNFERIKRESRLTAAYLCLI